MLMCDDLCCLSVVTWAGSSTQLVRGFLDVEDGAHLLAPYAIVLEHAA